MNREKICKSIVSVMLILAICVATGNQVRAAVATSTTAERNYIAKDWSFYKNGTTSYNCLAYSLGNTTSWVWPWGSKNPTAAQVRTYMSGKGYSSVYGSGPINGKVLITAYELDGGITHFAKSITSSTYAVRAKWGALELFNHKTMNPYTNNVYGSLAMRFYKPGQY